MSDQKSKPCFMCLGPGFTVSGVPWKPIITQCKYCEGTGTDEWYQKEKEKKNEQPRND